jgi:hypothetical protein
MQMVGISVKLDIKACTASLNDIARKQIPFATFTALNDVAFQVQRAETANMAAVFKSPRPFTAKSTQVDKATRSKPWLVVVRIRDEVAKYLMPYEVGGVHVLPGPELLDPKNTSLDQYGQLRRNAVKRLAARKRVFFGTVHGVTGFWLRPPKPAKGQPRGKLTLLIRFGAALPVKQHLNFHTRGLAVVKATFVAAFKKAMVNAIATAKKTP